MALEPSQSDSPRAVGPAWWLVIVLLAVVAGALVMERSRTAVAVGQGVAEPPVGSKGLIAVAGQLSRDTYGLYLIDTEKGKMCVYQYQAANGQLGLLAVRNFVYDMGLDAYNTVPSPREMKDLVEQQGRVVVPPPAPASAPAKE
ncbi:MAG: hypothetical protein ABSH10_02595 [Phycisphaerae bacterium]|jgi:hypothetical protein